MARWRGALRFTLLALVVAAAASQAAAVAPIVKDDGKFFSAEAIKKANDEIQAIARKYDKDVLVETYPTVPGNQLDKVKAMTRVEREKFFQIWAEERAEAVVVRGLYILVCKEPAHIQVVVTNRGGAPWPARSRRDLVDLLIKKFRDKKYDEGLADALKLVGEQLKATGSR